MTLLNGLVGWWKLNNGSALDSSGNGNNGTVQGAVATTDRLGKRAGALTFDGLDDFVVINSNLGLGTTDTITVSLWFNFRDATEMTLVNQYIVPGWAVSVFGAVFQTINLMPGHNRGRRSSNLQTGKWYHGVTIIYPNATHPDIYINGVIDNAFSFGLGTPAQLYVGHTTWIGADKNNNRRYTNGSLDDVRIYNRALTAAEVLALYQLTTIEVSRAKVTGARVSNFPRS